jgi:hypothetical protein
MSDYALVTGASTVQGLAADGINVYWTDSGNNTINGIPRSGGASVVLAMNQFSPMRIAVDGTSLYWSNNLGAAIMTMPANGATAPVVLANAGEPWGVALDATDVYWANRADSSIMRIAKTGAPGMNGTQVTIVSGPPSSLAVDGTNVYFLTAPDATDAGALYRVSKNGGTAVQLALPPENTVIGGIALDDIYVYWVDVDIGGVGISGPVYRMAKAGGAAQLLASTYGGGGTPDVIATDGCSLYVFGSDATGEKLVQLSVWGGPMTAIGVPGSCLTIDDTYAYTVYNNVIYRSPR